ncbi:MAG: sensor histidine kinase [Cyclobacteriaceae bacterium]|nr:sensor histidine kinase [Cyclobacteriaceae bacterium]
MKRTGTHILFWAAYVMFKTYLNVSAGSDIFFTDQPVDWGQIFLHIKIQLLVLLVKIPLVYFAFYTLDKFVQRQWNLLLVTVTLLTAFCISSICLSALYNGYVLPVLLDYTGELSIFGMASLIYYFFTLAFVVGIACSIRLLKRQYQSRIREAELQKEKTQAELKYLKGQINPHFLFNTLNNIYALARKGSAQTSDAVMKLSKLMRFMLYEAGHSTILLTDELKLIQDYIELEKLRYGDRLSVTYAEEVDNPHQTIAPLILIHFVENAFKHGASESRFDSFIIIKISLRNHVLNATIINSKASGSISKPENPIGIENIKRQLELVYPDHTLDLQNDSDRFAVSLTIPLPAQL